MSAKTPFRWVELTCACCEDLVTVSSAWARDYSACPPCIGAGCTENTEGENGECFKPVEEKPLPDSKCAADCFCRENKSLPWAKDARCWGQR